jgi:hypothetical protein
MSDQLPVSREQQRRILDALAVAFPAQAIKQREGGRGRRFDYVETQTVIRRLNTDAVGWDFQIKSLERHPMPPKQDGKTQDLYVCVGALTIPGLGTREGIGVQVVTEGGGEDLLKGVSSDALKKAATLFGVALDLYGPDYEAGEIAQPPQSERTPRNAPQARQDAPRATAAPQTAPSASETADEPLVSEEATKALAALAIQHKIPWGRIDGESMRRWGNSPAGLRVSQARELYRWVRDLELDPEEAKS